MLKYGNDPRKAVSVAEVDGELNGNITGLFNSFKKLLLNSFSQLGSVVEPSFVLSTS